MTEKKLAASLNLVAQPGESPSCAMARSEIEPAVRHAVAQRNASGSLFPGDHCDMNDRLSVALDISKAVAAGELATMSNLLTSQALTLDAVMTQMLMSAQANMGEFPQAHERYMRLALKAQAQSRATVEALVKMHQPREQVVRHVHVYEGGQAVVAEQLHMHGPGGRFAGTSLQPHATGTADPGECTALPCPNAIGNRVPGAGGQREEALPDARRSKGKRRA